MKKLLVIALISLSACGNSGNGNKPAGDSSRISTSVVSNPATAGGVDTVAAARKPTMDFKDTVHDFSTLHENEVVSHEFTFTNNGKTPLIITNAHGSCGCTVPDYPREPVQPGQSATLKVTFNSAGKSGPQEKSVSITANTLRNIHMLFIKADVKTK